jgi:hypothetical protein
LDAKLDVIVLGDRFAWMPEFYANGKFIGLKEGICSFSQARDGPGHFAGTLNCVSDAVHDWLIEWEEVLRVIYEESEKCKNLCSIVVICTEWRPFSYPDPVYCTKWDRVPMAEDFNSWQLGACVRACDEKRRDHIVELDPPGVEGYLEVSRGSQNITFTGMNITSFGSIPM